METFIKFTASMETSFSESFRSRPKSSTFRKRFPSQLFIYAFQEMILTFFQIFYGTPLKRGAVDTLEHL